MYFKIYTFYTTRSAYEAQISLPMKHKWDCLWNTDFFSSSCMRWEVIVQHKYLRGSVTPQDYDIVRWCIRLHKLTRPFPFPSKCWNHYLVPRSLCQWWNYPCSFLMHFFLPCIKISGPWSFLFCSIILSMWNPFSQSIINCYSFCCKNIVYIGKESIFSWNTSYICVVHIVSLVQFQNVLYSILYNSKPMLLHLPTILYPRSSRQQSFAWEMFPAWLLLF